MNAINKITNRMSDLGYPQDIYFPEIEKISNILANSNQSALVKKYVEECSRRAYELGIMDETLDKLLEELYLTL